MAKKVNPMEATQVMRNHNLEPLQDYPGASKPWLVRCTICGTHSTPTYAHVNSRGGGCRECGKKRSADAKRISPKSAIEFMQSQGFEPLEPFRAGKSPWKCVHLICGSVVSPQYTNVVGGQGGCKYCGKLESSRKRRLDADKVTAEVISLGYIPLEEFPGTKTSWKFQCVDCGDQFVTTLDSARSRAHPSCGKCSKARAGQKRRLPTEEAAKSMSKIGLIPLEDFPGVHKSWKCKCEICGQETFFRLTSARLRIAKDSKNPHQGCEECVFVQIGKERMLDQAEAEHRLSKLNMKILGTYLGTFEPVKAVCLKCGSENEVRLGKASNRGRACKSCSLIDRVNASKTPESEAIQRMLKAGFKPLVPYVNYNSPWMSIHLECGNEASPSLGSIKGGGGCPSCAKYGFDMTSKAVLYVLFNHKLQAVKVGITGVNTSRIQRLYKQHGWTIVKWFKFETGREARDIERVVLNWWRQDLHLPYGVTSLDAGRLGGWTETAPASQISPEQTVKYVRGVLGKFLAES